MILLFIYLVIYVLITLSIHLFLYKLHLILQNEICKCCRICLWQHLAVKGLNVIYTKINEYLM